MKEKIGPRVCPICGITFMPRRFDQVSCGAEECKYKWKNRDRSQRNGIRHRSKKEEFEPYQWKGDTIVAIGYADRQKEQTLSMVPKIDTTL